MTSHVPFLDLRSQNNLLIDELMEAFRAFIQSGQYILGENVSGFEHEFALFCQSEYCIGLSNGLDALTILLRASGVKPGDEVIVPSNTYIATWLAIVNVGATIVPVEPDDRQYLVSVDAVESLITERTKAIIIVHLYGQCCDLPGFMNLGESYGIPIFEDAAQAHGATFSGYSPGQCLSGAAYSFYPSKNLGALGDAGAIVTQDPEIDRFARLYRNYGSRKKYFNEIAGGNCRLDELQAAFLRVKLKHLSAANKARQGLAERYIERLSSLPVNLPRIHPLSCDVWHLFVMSVDPGIRDRICSHLKRKFIDTMFHYPLPPHRQAAFRGTQIADYNLPVSELIHNSVLSLPIGPTFSTETIDYVCDCLIEFFD